MSDAPATVVMYVRFKNPAVNRALRLHCVVHDISLTKAMNEAVLEWLYSRGVTDPEKYVSEFQDKS